MVLLSFLLHIYYNYSNFLFQHSPVSIFKWKLESHCDFESFCDMRISFIHHVFPLNLNVHLYQFFWIFYSFSLICSFYWFNFGFLLLSIYSIQIIGMKLGIHSQNADGEDCSSSSFSSASRASLDQTDCLHQSSSGSGENLILLCNSDSSSKDSPSSYQNAEWITHFEILNFLWMFYLFH